MYTLDAVLLLVFRGSGPSRNLLKAQKRKYPFELYREPLQSPSTRGTLAALIAERRCAEGEPVKEADLGLDLSARRTRNFEFLNQMERVAPWVGELRLRQSMHA